MKSEGLFQRSKAFFRCGDASLFKRLWFTAITKENEHFLSFTAVLLQMQHTRSVYLQVSQLCANITRVFQTRARVAQCFLPLNIFQTTNFTAFSRAKTDRWSCRNEGDASSEPLRRKVCLNSCWCDGAAHPKALSARAVLNPGQTSSWSKGMSGASVNGFWQSQAWPARSRDKMFPNRFC